MSVRSKVSKKNPYYLEKHRYYELMHFCLQYPIWKKRYKELHDTSNNRDILGTKVDQSIVSDSVEKIAEQMMYYSNRIEMVEKNVYETDADIGQFLLLGVTEKISYDILQVQYDIPCSRDTYYLLYRKFFWLLDRVRE